jgi:hypothetical protein
MNVGLSNILGIGFDARNYQIDDGTEFKQLVANVRDEVLVLLLVCAQDSHFGSWVSLEDFEVN